MTHHWLLPEDFPTTRLDQALAKLAPEHSRSLLGRYIDEGRVRVGETKITKRSHPVSSGQQIELEVPPARSSELDSQDLPLNILYQDDDIAVIDKPAGMVVHPAAGHADATLVNALLFHLTNLSGIGGEIRPGIVHRLDKDTSGLLVVAKNDAAHRYLTERWNSEEIEKTYLALVYGHPKKERGTIDAPIGRDPRDRKRMAVVAEGRSAVTLYDVVEAYRYASLLRCRLKSGRTHQIRVHLKSIGHPVIGDPTYSGPQWRGIPDKPLQRILASVKRQALHATRLTLPHPRTGEKMTFESPLPDDLSAVLTELRKRK